MAKAKSAVIQISRKGMLVWVGLFLFVAAWMFVLGIMVGRGIAPVELEKDELAELKAKKLQQEKDLAEKQVSGQGGDKPQLGFYEALKVPRAEKQMKPVAPPKPKPKPAAKPKVVEKKTAQPKPVAAKPAAKPVTKPAAKPVAQRTTAASTPDSTKAAKGHFAIQVSAVKEVQRAAQLVAQLRKKGYRAYQIRSQVAGKGVWYRVRVGAYESRAAAGPTLKKLKGDRYAGMVISTQ